MDWKDDKTFASCSTDRSIQICHIDEALPLAALVGHKDEVNSIKWDPSGNILASCSDDTTAKLWALGQPKCLHNLREHSKEIYTIRWSPTGTGSVPSLPLCLSLFPLCLSPSLTHTLLVAGMCNHAAMSCGQVR